jgi:hypothetical protein
MESQSQTAKWALINVQSKTPAVDIYRWVDFRVAKASIKATIDGETNRWHDHIHLEIATNQ